MACIVHFHQICFWIILISYIESFSEHQSDTIWLHFYHLPILEQVQYFYRILNFPKHYVDLAILLPSVHSRSAGDFSCPTSACFSPQYYWGPWPYLVEEYEKSVAMIAW